MIHKVILLVLCTIIFQNVAVTQQLPLIHARDATVDIRVGESYFEKAWQIMPEYKPDIYSAAAIGESITFYTDMDSISFVLQKNVSHEFIILLNGVDTAFTQIKYEPSYLDKLKLATEYKTETDFEIPSFRYQEASDPSLIRLRKTYQLDSIAGRGNELSQLLNLMHWVHDLIKHDGNHENPEIKNASSLIQSCASESRGLNCRGLATVLNDCYLAMGFKARFLTCMPKDSVFQDCHVINIVFSNDLNKWIWLDPTHDAYVMDKKGELLGPAEVREKLINDEILILNPDANWNRQHSTLKEYYLLEYMAKNLYRFSSPLYSEYDYETNKKGNTRTYVELIPLDGFNQEPKVLEKKYLKSGITFRTYKTNDPTVFWAEPK